MKSIKQQVIDALQESKNYARRIEDELHEHQAEYTNGEKTFDPDLELQFQVFYNSRSSTINPGEKSDDSFHAIQLYIDNLTDAQWTKSMKDAIDFNLEKIKKEIDEYAEKYKKQYPLNDE
ncbi:hypothetical protein [Spirosoma sp. KNUC1025]|uniref:hypothetical protein n=1 Tax=Spirosoma sp. KNUC1025 TaxID=2894082 RepID=UPI00386ED5A3|nr:hypothetical protein LN737_15215 [Spirosoma sp. KNUC1025]